MFFIGPFLVVQRVLACVSVVAHESALKVVGSPVGGVDEVVERPAFAALASPVDNDQGRRGKTKQCCGT